MATTLARKPEEPAVASGSVRHLRVVPINEPLKPYDRGPAETTAEIKADKDLLDSIVKDGIRDHIMVSARMAVISGHRRLRQAKAAGFTEVTVEVCEDIDTPQKEFEAVHACDNQLQRKKDCAMRIALNFAHDNHLDPVAVVKGLGYSPPVCTRVRKLAAMAEPIQCLVRQGGLRFSAIPAIDSLPADQRQSFVDTAVAERWTAKKITEALKPKPSRKRQPEDKFERDGVALSAIRTLTLESIRKACSAILSAIEHAERLGLPRTAAVALLAKLHK